MNLARNLDQAPKTNRTKADYDQAVDVLLLHRYGTTIAAQFANNVVEAARSAGYSPSECAEWLAKVDGLE